MTENGNDITANDIVKKYTEEKIVNLINCGKSLYSYDDKIIIIWLKKY